LSTYVIRRAATAPPLDGDWDDRCWSKADVADISHFHPASSSHRPRTRAKVLYDDTGLHLFFTVSDQYVRCVRQNFQDQVCRDSCVEFFVQPEGSPGYFNFEFNCGGTMLLMYIVDPTREGSAFKDSISVASEWANLVRVRHSLPRRIEPEITTAINWNLQAHIPFRIFEPYIKSPVKMGNSATWRGNFYKCGDDTSHPHWASWNAIGDELNFHQPAKFGAQRFE